MQPHITTRVLMVTTVPMAVSNCPDIGNSANYDSPKLGTIDEQRQYDSYNKEASTGGGNSGYSSYGDRDQGQRQSSRSSSYTSGRDVSSTPSGSKLQSQDTIYISGLPSTTTEQKLIDHFGSIGVIKVRYRHKNHLDTLLDR